MKPNMAILGAHTWPLQLSNGAMPYLCSATREAIEATQWIIVFHTQSMNSIVATLPVHTWPLKLRYGAMP